MRLKNRFKNRFCLKPISNGKYQYRVDYSSKDFKAGVIACLANPHFRENWIYTIKNQVA